MTSSAWSLLALFLTLLLIASWPLGLWIARLWAGHLPGWMHKLETPLYRLAGTSPDQSMKWQGYVLALLAFNLLGALVVYGLQRVQVYLPLNPAGLVNVSPDSAFNTAISFAANTNWQGYSGESTMSYLTQMLALAVQNFLSAATGIAVLFALFRGFAAKSTGVLGNFWVDITRITVWLLLPLSFVLAIALAGQGVNHERSQQIKSQQRQRVALPLHGLAWQCARQPIHRRFKLMHPAWQIASPQPRKPNTQRQGGGQKQCQEKSQQAQGRGSHQNSSAQNSA